MASEPFAQAAAGVPEPPAQVCPMLRPAFRVVYVFTAGPYVNSLARKLDREAERRTKSLTVISYGFPIPGREPCHRTRAFFMYCYEAGQQP